VAVPAAIKHFLFIAVPMILLLIGISLFRDTFPHWSGPAWVTLMPLAAIVLAQKHAMVYPRALRAAIVLAGCVALLGLGLIFFYPGSMGYRQPERFGKGDFTLDMSGWTGAGKAFATIKQNAEKNGLMPEGAPMVSSKWFPAAHLDYYFCRPQEMAMVGLGSLHDLHHYYWLNAYRIKDVSMEKAWLVVPSTEPVQPSEAFSSYYNSIDSLATITAVRGGRPARYFRIYRLSGWKGQVPMIR
jgi:hypothetical protein